ADRWINFPTLREIATLELADILAMRNMTSFALLSSALVCWLPGNRDTGALEALRDGLETHAGQIAAYCSMRRVDFHKQGTPGGRIFHEHAPL
ncbi:MAG: hypothetical protein ACREVC_14975, partial [Burkholderiales bacterium]